MSHRRIRFHSRILSCGFTPALVLMLSLQAHAAEEPVASATQAGEAAPPAALAAHEAATFAKESTSNEKAAPIEAPVEADKVTSKATPGDAKETTLEAKETVPAKTETPQGHVASEPSPAHETLTVREGPVTDTLHDGAKNNEQQTPTPSKAADEAAHTGSVNEDSTTKQTPDPHAPADTQEPTEKPAHGEAAAKETKDAHGATAAHGAPAAHGESAAHGENKEVPAEIMSMQATELLKYADKAFEDGRYDMAQIGYRQLLTYKMPKGQIRTALLGFGRALKKQGELTKAVAVFERLIKDFPAEQDTPEIYLELGRCQRALGAYKTAINRFYSVLNSTIKLTEDGAAKYRQLAKTAQFEIAETYFIAGDYKEAMRFYSRLRLLDLNPSDRARAHFKAAYSQQLAGDQLGSITQLRSFIELNPEDENVPEARYLIAMGLRTLGRNQDALFEALELLRTERTRTAQDPKRWAYWQRKTGNQIANEFYNQGDTTSALAIYLSLVELSSEPAWRGPILYQIALCQERQGRKDKAIESYKSILDIAAAQKGDDPRKADFTELARMATWRLSQIEWVHNAEQRLNTLLPNIDSEGAQPNSAPPAK